MRNSGQNGQKWKNAEILKKRILLKNYLLLFDTYFYTVKINILKKKDFGPFLSKVTPKGPKMAKSAKNTKFSWKKGRFGFHWWVRVVVFSVLKSTKMTKKSDPQKWQNWKKSIFFIFHLLQTWKYSYLLLVNHGFEDE